ncbi:UvrD-helicase domain-containing protein [Nocardia asiatica]|uniref:UvrD-helicase domain-containing protein n=1 Tax=Nocardia asiatica TaxID=209252 RepID=UPI002454737B|nr:UvrD-helicase domain-containing protein [Nocardia asiatica]
MNRGWHSQEVRRQQVYDALNALPGLPPGYRSVFAGMLMERGAYLLVRDPIVDVPTGRAHALLVGRGGVFALIFTTTAPTSQTIDAVRARTQRLFDKLTVGSNVFVASTVRVALVVPVGTDLGHVDNRVVVAEERTLRRAFFAGRVLEQRDAEHVAKAVADRSEYRPVHIAETGTDSEPEAQGLFEENDAIADQRERALSEPLLTWLSFLDPDQLSLVRRNYNGPARIIGPAGTGKTVVALHRLARIARESTGKLLLTSFVRSLPACHRTPFTRLAPEVVDRVEFIGLHAWASQFLRLRGKPVRMEPVRARTALSLAWAHVGGENGPLADIEPNLEYWADEIDRLIKGRGITDYDDYAALVRTGREGLALRREDQRPLVWNLFEEYERIRREREVFDANDLIAAALAELPQRPLDPPYSMVVVDEVQDVTLMGLRLVGEIAANTPNSLLFVGDGQQQVYPGGWRLSHAGFDVRNRSELLAVNYRNRAAILAYAKGIDARNTVDDLDGGTGVTLRDARGVLDGGHVDEWEGPDNQLDAALTTAIRALGAPNGHVAVITRTNTEANRFLRVLKAAGIPIQLLEDYNGSYIDAVKVGTVQRAKGLEFPAVFRPVLPGERPRRRTASQQDTDELAARRQLVAVTRARDYLWLGIVDGALPVLTDSGGR